MTRNNQRIVRLLNPKTPEYIHPQQSFAGQIGHHRDLDIAYAEAAKRHFRNHCDAALRLAIGGRESSWGAIFDARVGRHAGRNRDETSAGVHHKNQRKTIDAAGAHVMAIRLLRQKQRVTGGITH